MENPVFDKSLLTKVAVTLMPFGRYKGRAIVDLPEAYLLWFQHQGFPRGELGQLLELALEISVTGSRDLVKKLKYA